MFTQIYGQKISNFKQVVHKYLDQVRVHTSLALPVIASHMGLMSSPFMTWFDGLTVYYLLVVPWLTVYITNDFDSVQIENLRSIQSSFQSKSTHPLW